MSVLSIGGARLPRELVKGEQRYREFDLSGRWEPAGATEKENPHELSLRPARPES